MFQLCHAFQRIFSMLLAVPRSRVTGSRDRRDPNRVPLAASSVPRAQADLGLGSEFFGVFSKPSNLNQVAVFFPDFWCPSNFDGIRVVIQDLILVESRRFGALAVRNWNHVKGQNFNLVRL